jgi:4a-hydroxytetrahydrobiopterin dehydratase
MSSANARLLGCGQPRPADEPPLPLKRCTGESRPCRGAPRAATLHPMPSRSAADLVATKCVPCEGGVPRYTPAEAEAQLAALPAWRLTHDGRRIRRDWKFKTFREAIKLLNNVAALAEREQHHPDLHLEGYRQAWVEIHTHAIGGLSENDFVLAAKIDAIAPA